MRQLFEEILARAHAQHVLRADFTLPDLALILWSFAPVIDATQETAPEAWRRHLHFILDGLRPGAATPQTEPSLADEQLAEAMHCLREHRFRHRHRDADR